MIASLSLLALLTVGQTIDLPEKIDAKAGRMAAVTIKTDAKSITWAVVPPGDIDLFREFDPDPGVIRLRFLPYADGTFYLAVSSAAGDKVTQRICTIRAIGATPKPPTPEPEPIDPPKPEPKPTPPPIALPGLRALVVAEFTRPDEAAKERLLTPRQIDELWGESLAAYVKSTFAKDAAGVPEFRRFDKNQDESKLAPAWQQAFAAWRAAGSPVPGIVVSNGKTGFVGALPDRDIVELLKKYEPK